MQSFSVFGVRIDDPDQKEYHHALKEGSGLFVTVNPEILLCARQQESYREVLNAASLCLADGIATRFAVAAMTGSTGLHRYPGVEVAYDLLGVAEMSHEPVVLLGGYPEDHPELKARIKKQFPDVVLQIIDPGVVSDDNPYPSQEVLDALNEMQAKIVLLGLGQGKGRRQGRQEKYGQAIVLCCPTVRIVIGVGGTLDVMSGRVGRAPAVFRRFGFEWLWRLVVNPWRLPRILRAVVVFPSLVVFDTLQKKRFIAALWAVFRSLLPRL